MKKYEISEELRNVVNQLIVKGIYPNASYEVVNQVLREMSSLIEIKSEKAEEKAAPTPKEK